eukprot:702959-Pyramimonas_sp.AAC.1
MLNWVVTPSLDTSKGAKDGAPPCHAMSPCRQDLPGPALGHRWAYYPPCGPGHLFMMGGKGGWRKIRLSI